MLKDRTYIRVILPLRLDWEPYYYVPAEMAKEGLAAGMRVSVLFARKKYLGVVSAAGIEPDVEEGKINAVLSLERGLETITANELELWRFVSGYYLCTVGEVYKAAYPQLKVDKEVADAKREEKRLSVIDRKLQALASRKDRLSAFLEKKRAAAERAKSDSSKKKFSDEAEKYAAQISLVEQSLSMLEDEKVSGPDNVRCFESSYEVSLSAAQNDAYSAVKSAFQEHLPVLLNGITGSGKTEIYVKLALETMRQGKNVLYMIPEIAVSRQLEERLRRIFGVYLFTFHSKVTAAKREDVASEIRSGNYMVLGTRSSIFLPHHDLGLIIVDEEHDTSYKQDAPAPRYNGRDTALMLARIYGAEIILGTATPSLESLYNCRIGRMRKVDLPERYYGASDSDVEIIDTSAERRKRGMAGNFSFKLIQRIRTALADGGQVLLLRARRAYSPAVQCTACGDIPRCPHCNVPLSWHRQEGILLCHYCGWRTPFSGKCAKCGGTMEALGAGTQKIEEEVSNLFPEARVARLDSDTAAVAGKESEIIRDFADRKIDILVGTQIITKGFDFDGLSLVAVLMADSLLGQQDFRADERAFQLLEQFRGRTGRRGQKGILVIQTSRPDHPVYQAFSHENEDGVMSLASGAERKALIESMMDERQAFGYPPFSRIVRVIVKDANEARLEKLSRMLYSAIVNAFGVSVSGFVQTFAQPVSVVGPYPPAVDRQSDIFLRHLRVSFRKDGALSDNKRKLVDIVKAFETQHAYTAHVALDVDPV